MTSSGVVLVPILIHWRSHDADQERTEAQFNSEETMDGFMNSLWSVKLHSRTIWTCGWWKPIGPKRSQNKTNRLFIAVRVQREFRGRRLSPLCCFIIEPRWTSFTTTVLTFPRQLQLLCILWRRPCAALCIHCMWACWRSTAGENRVCKSVWMSWRRWRSAH